MPFKHMQPVISPQSPQAPPGAGLRIFGFLGVRSWRSKLLHFQAPQLGGLQVLLRHVADGLGSRSQVIPKHKFPTIWHSLDGDLMHEGDDVLNICSTNQSHFTIIDRAGKMQRER